MFINLEKILVMILFQITEPWSWYVSGPLIALVLFFFYFFGKGFGVSTNLETICTLMGAGKVSSYFNKDWKDRSWSLAFIVGLVIGGAIAINFLSDGTVKLAMNTQHDLNELGFIHAGEKSLMPSELFSLKSLFTLKGFLILFFSGICIGFGTRYAGGCTSGHAITGLSNFQIPSFFAVIGFFTGGIVMVWFIFPLIFKS